MVKKLKTERINVRATLDMVIDLQVIKNLLSQRDDKNYSDSQIIEYLLKLGINEVCKNN